MSKKGKSNTPSNIVDTAEREGYPSPESNVEDYTTYPLITEEFQQVKSNLKLTEEQAKLIQIQTDIFGYDFEERKEEILYLSNDESEIDYDIHYIDRLLRGTPAEASPGAV